MEENGIKVEFGLTANDYATHRAGFPDSFFDRLAARFRLGQDIVIVDRLGIESPRGVIYLSGVIQDLTNPQLELSGRVRLQSEDQSQVNLNFRVTGPAGRPQIKMTSLK